jgi:hypothetical protein
LVSGVQPDQPHPHGLSGGVRLFHLAYAGRAGALAVKENCFIVVSKLIWEREEKVGYHKE